MKKILHCSMTRLLLVVLTCLNTSVLCYKILNLNMPEVSPRAKETYLCTSKKLPKRTSYAYKFRPNAEEGTAHHMLVFACNKPAQHKEFWECNDNPCGESGFEQIIYAWAKNADPLELPKHVAFPLGEEYDLEYIVMQIHYARPLKADEMDSSGVSVYLTKYEPQFFASIYLFSSNFFTIPPKRKGYHVDVSCHYSGPSIKPFAYRTHAHSHSHLISAYRIRGEEWSLIGQGDPQKPQAFYPIEKTERLLIKSGDLLAARCTFDTSHETHSIHAGMFSSSEMCNFYMMYYTLNTDSNENMDTPFGCSHSTNKLIFPTDLHPSSHHTTKTETNALTDRPTHISSATSISSEVENNTPTHTTPPTDSPSKSNDALKPVLDPKWNIRSDIKTRLGNIGSLGVDLGNHIIILHTGDRSLDDTDSFDDKHFYLKQQSIQEDTIVVYADDGSFMKSFGSNFFYLPSSLHIDQHGHYLITDAGLHQVFKFDPSKFDQPILTLGQEKYPGHDDTHFCSPVAVVTDLNDNIYVADGLCNNRIVKLDSEGRFIKEFGKKHFKHPSSLAIDGNHIYVQEMGASKIHVFDHEGKHVSEFSHGLESDSVLMAHCQCQDDFLYVISDDTGNVIQHEKNDNVIVSHWNMKNIGKTQDLVISLDHKYLYIARKNLNEIRRYRIKHEDMNKNSEREKVLPKFPWLQVKTTIVTKNTSSIEDKMSTMSPYDDDDITVVPAVVVVAVLAAPIVLVLLALIIQHIRLKNRVNRAARRRTLDTYSKGGLCTCCCVTPRYYYDSKRGFDNLIKNDYKDNDDLTSSGEEEEEEDLFTRKA